MMRRVSACPEINASHKCFYNLTNREMFSSKFMDLLWVKREIDCYLCFSRSVLRCACFLFLAFVCETIAWLFIASNIFISDDRLCDPNDRTLPFERNTIVTIQLTDYTKHVFLVIYPLFS